MEWEYLHGTLQQSGPTDPRYKVIVLDDSSGAHGQASLAQLGADRWELIQAVPIDNKVLALFKREKLISIGAKPKQKAEST